MTTSRSNEFGFLAGGGEMAGLIRQKDWSETPLGPIETWPSALRAALGISLNVSFPACIYWGQEMRLLYNDAWSQIPGDRHPSTLGRPAHEAWPDIWDVIGPMFNRIMDTGVAVHTEDGLLAMQRQGRTEERYFNYNVSPIHDEEGIAGLFNVVIETTDRVLAERRAELLRSLGNATYHAHSRQEICARAAGAIRDDPFDLPFCQFYLLERDQTARLAAAVGLVAGTTMAPSSVGADEAGPYWPLGKAADCPEGLLHSFAEHRSNPLVLAPWPEPMGVALIVPIANEVRKGELLGYMVAGISPRRPLDGPYRSFITNIARHISARAAAIEALEQERRQSELLERRVEERTRERDRIWQVSRDLLLVADLHGTFIAVNPAWRHLLGWSEEELVGRTAAWLNHPDDVQPTREELERLVRGEATFGFENRFRHKDGHYLSFAWTAALEAGMIYAVARNVTHEKEAAAALRQVQDQLRQSQKMEAIGQLTGGIAHDFNNLLQGITGSLDLVQRRIEQGRTEEVGRFLSGAMTSANRAAALTHRLLAFSRRQPLDPRPLEINPLLASMESLIQRTVGERIEAELLLAADLWPTLCDANQFEAAIVNLAINARDAMPRGGKLTIETCNMRLDDPAQGQGVPQGDYVCVSVTDTGIGMAPDVVERAFDPFFTTKPMGHGTGLGLSMIYGFARQSDGYARISSELERGTTVKLFLPRLLDEAETPMSAASVETGSDGDGRTIVMVVEDEAVVRLLVVELLHELGYDVCDYPDAVPALDVLRSPQRIDLLVTDIGLPGMNGRQLADAARAVRPDLRVLFMTGYAENAAIASGFLDPGMALITKPFALDTMSARIREIMTKGRKPAQR
jgi:PAS domain S-box-containing protein